MDEARLFGLHENPTIEICPLFFRAFGAELIAVDVSDHTTLKPTSVCHFVAKPHAPVSHAFGTDSSPIAKVRFPPIADMQPASLRAGLSDKEGVGNDLWYVGSVSPDVRQFTREHA